MEDRIKKLQSEIKILEDMGEDEIAAKKRAELKNLLGAKSTTATTTPTTGAFVLPISEEEYIKAGSKFAAAGLHLSEFGMPDWDTPNVSIKFPFTIIEEGPDKGKEGKISAGVSREAVWKLKEILTALGVELKMVKGPDGISRPSFNPMDVVGKVAMTLWVKQKDTRSIEEGGKGTTYTKPVSVHPIGTSIEELEV